MVSSKRLALDRFQQIIHRFQPEGLDGKLLVSGGKNHMRRFYVLLAKAANHTKAIKPGHLDVEKRERRVEPLNGVERLETVAGHSHHFDIANLIEKELQFFARQLFVVGDDRTHRRGRAGSHELLL